MNDIKFLKSLYMPCNLVKEGGNVPYFSSTIHSDAQITFNNWHHNRDQTLNFIHAFCQKMESIHVELKEISCLNKSKRCYVILSNWTLEVIGMKGVKEICPMMEVISLKGNKIIRATGVMHLGGKLGNFLKDEHV